jgi:hypothetical protein
VEAFYGGNVKAIFVEHEIIQGVPFDRVVTKCICGSKYCRVIETHLYTGTQYVLQAEKMPDSLLVETKIGAKEGIGLTMQCEGGCQPFKVFISTHKGQTYIDMQAEVEDRVPTKDTFTY